MASKTNQDFIRKESNANTLSKINVNINENNPFINNNIVGKNKSDSNEVNILNLESDKMKYDGLEKEEKKRKNTNENINKNNNDKKNYK